MSFNRWGSEVLRHPGFLIGPVLVLLLGACSAPEERRPVAPIIIDEEEAPVFSIDRADYEETIKSGLQPVMRWYIFTPAYDARSRFLGFRVARILNERLQQGPLEVGDVLLRINGMPIEKPGQVEAVWRGLWSRRDLTLDFLRQGAPVSLKIPVVSPLVSPQNP